MGRGDSSLLKSTCCVRLQRTRVSSWHKVESPRIICNSSSGGHSMMIAWFFSSGSQSQWRARLWKLWAELGSSSLTGKWVLGIMCLQNICKSEHFLSSSTIFWVSWPLFWCLSFPNPAFLWPRVSFTHHPSLLMTPALPSQVTSKFPIWDG